jgi:hypothetical protein
MPNDDLHKRIMTGMWLAVVAILVVMFALYARDAKAQEKYVADTPEAFWGEKWPDIMRLYYPHDHSHGMWFNRKTNCCGGKDCFPARPGTVKWTPDGYRVLMPDGGFALVPEEKAPYNPEDVTENRALVCLVFYGTAYRADTVAHGITYSKTGYRIRPHCMWSGRPRI